MRSFVSIPAGVFHVPLLRYASHPSAPRSGASASRASAGRSARQEEFAFHYVDYAIIATLVAGAAWLRGSSAAGRKDRPDAARLLRREDRPRRRQGAVRAARAGVPGGLRARAPVGPLHLRPRGDRVRGGGRGVPRRAARDRRRQRHRRDRARARGDGDRHTGGGAQRRGDLPVVHLLRDGGGDRPRRRDPVFADIDPVTLNLDPDDVARRITPRTKAIMPVHLFGRPRRSRAGRARAAAARGRGASLRADGTTTGVCSTFSFFPTKNLFALGDGGLVAATDDAVAERVACSAFTAPATRRPSS